MAVVKMTQRTIIEATVTRADGTVEDLGVICDTAKETLLQKLIKGVKK